MIKNKFLIIILIVTILSVLIVPSTSKASVAFEAIDSDYDFYNVPNFPEPWKLPNCSYLQNVKSKNFMFIENDYFVFYMCYHAQTLAAQYNSSGKLMIYTAYVSGSSVTENVFVYKCPTNDISGGWILDRRGNSGYTHYYTFSDIKVIYASENIMDARNSSNPPFFPQTPLKMGLKLGQPMQVQDLLKMTNKLMTIITPIGLVIFSTVLVIFLLKSKKWHRF